MRESAARGRGSLVLMLSNGCLVCGVVVALLKGRLVGVEGDTHSKVPRTSVLVKLKNQTPFSISNLIHCTRMRVRVRGTGNLVRNA